MKIWGTKGWRKNCQLDARKIELGSSKLDGLKIVSFFLSSAKKSAPVRHPCNMDHVASQQANTPKINLLAV